MKRLLLILLAAAPLVAADTKPEPHAAPAPAFLGVGLDEVDDALAYHLELKNDLGVMVGSVAPGSPAEAMGLKPYDVIVAADGQPVYTPRAFTGMVRAKAPGDSIEIQVRRGPRTEEVSGKLVARPAELDAERRDQPGHFRHPLIPGAPGQQGNVGGERRGTLRQPDGSTMEWSIEDGPQPPTP
jgi:predicted metalloprotease with PDZ domain